MVQVSLTGPQHGLRRRALPIRADKSIWGVHGSTKPTLFLTDPIFDRPKPKDYKPIHGLK